MYTKNLTEDLRLRLSTTDMDFLRSLSDERQCSISEVIRSLISEYRRGLDAIEVLRSAIEISKSNGGGLSNGDTKTDKHDIV